MEQVMEQLNAISAQLAQLNQKQIEHDRVLVYLNEKTQQPPPQVLEPEVAKQTNMLDLFRIPDPIKSIPSFDGNRRQLTAWLKTVEDTLNVFEPLVSEQQFKLYLQAINNKIEGKAKDQLCLAGNPQNFCEIKQILLESLGDRQELSYYKSQLWATKQGEAMNIHNYFGKMKEIMQNIKSLSKQNKLYNEAWPAINAFIDEDGLAAFISGLRKPYFGYAQAAKPKGIEEAYAFLCKFITNEMISNNTKKFGQSSSSNNATQSNKVNVFQQRNSSSTINRKQPHVDRDKPTPMSIDLSMRSKNTFNKAINSHETLETGNSQPIENESQEDAFVEFEAYPNFQEDQQEDTED